ncbi:hypothetical protein SAMN04488688_11440 [Paenibacillus sp. cl141a]|uniref:hypothetical protein n=1 Tax=Paenibacillus sp. cl141a TaxID=1761877 RepID=UPI0008D8B88F|nr:hypothetical protein [Paenibacillus sp. cl141a]SEM52395.1 hypothetical protein SAMN04488688_11440 [Paenibacillus sp. cl141a]
MIDSLASDKTKQEKLIKFSHLVVIITWRRRIGMNFNNIPRLAAEIIVDGSWIDHVADIRSF